MEFEHAECIENTHIHFCKKLCVSTNGTNHVVLGKLERFSLSVGYMKIYILYGLKLVNIEIHGYHRKCYTMLLQLPNAGKNTQVSNVKKLYYSVH